MYTYSFITLIGLLGMVAFIIRAKMKELSIRKVHGASTMALPRLLSKEFILLITIANIVVNGPGWYLSNIWLNEFEYHTTFDPIVFLLNLTFTLFLAGIRVGFQLLKIAKINHARLLRID